MEIKSEIYKKLFDESWWRVREKTRIVVNNKRVVVKTISRIGTSFKSFIIGPKIVEIVLDSGLTITNRDHERTRSITRLFRFSRSSDCIACDHTTIYIELIRRKIGNLYFCTIIEEYCSRKC